MSVNGRLTAAELSPIPNGQLSNDAAAAWNAGPAKAGLSPLGPDSSYRSYERQQFYYSLYLSGRGNLAAFPGTSNHGWGHAIDLRDPSWMREWIIEHGHKYGWYWGEASSESWHVTFNPAWWTGKPEFKALRHGAHNNPARVKQLHKLLRHAGGLLPHPKPHRYWRGRYTTRFDRKTVRRVKRFQRDHGLRADGICGEKTWKKLRTLGRRDAA